jgi:hypothetical protein
MFYDNCLFLGMLYCWLVTGFCGCCGALLVLQVYFFAFTPLVIIFPIVGILFHLFPFLLAHSFFPLFLLELFFLWCVQLWDIFVHILSSKHIGFISLFKQILLLLICIHTLIVVAHLSFLVTFIFANSDSGSGCLINMFWFKIHLEILL